MIQRIDPQYILRCVQAGVKKRHWTRYRLVQEMGEIGRRRRSQLYLWLDGKADVTAQTASAALCAVARPDPAGGPKTEKIKCHIRKRKAIARAAKLTS